MALHMNSLILRHSQRLGLPKDRPVFLKWPRCGWLKLPEMGLVSLSLLSMHNSPSKVPGLQ